MANIGKAPDTLEGLRRDPNTGHYRVLPGYSHYANRFKINETWLDEDDDLWIDGPAVERIWSEGGPGAFQAVASPAHSSAGAA